MSKDLLKFLFGSSQAESSNESLAEAAEEIFSQMGQHERMEPKKSPLAAALKKIGVKVDGGLGVDPDGFCLTTDDGSLYREAKSLLKSADAMHALAELGWVVCDCGDEAMTFEVPEYKIRFLEIAASEPENSDTPVDLEKIAKDAYDFVNAPVVDEPEAPKIEKGGVGKVKPGDKAKSAIHGGKSKAESAEQAETVINCLLD